MNAPLISSRLYRAGHITILSLGLWVAGCQCAALIAGGFAGVSVIIFFSALVVAGCGRAGFRDNRRKAAKLGGFAILAIAVSWFLFYDCRNWKMVYFEQQIFNRCGYRDEYAFPGITIGDTVKIVSSHGIDLESEMDKLMRQDVSNTSLFTFVTCRFFRVSVWPPIEYIWKNGSGGVFGRFLR